MPIKLEELQTDVNVQRRQSLLRGRSTWGPNPPSLADLGRWQAVKVGIVIVIVMRLYREGA